MNACLITRVLACSARCLGLESVMLTSAQFDCYSVRKERRCRNTRTTHVGPASYGGKALAISPGIDTLAEPKCCLTLEFDSYSGPQLSTAKAEITNPNSGSQRLSLFSFLFNSLCLSLE